MPAFQNSRITHDNWYFILIHNYSSISPFPKESRFFYKSLSKLKNTTKNQIFPLKTNKNLSWAEPALSARVYPESAEREWINHILAPLDNYFYLTGIRPKTFVFSVSSVLSVAKIRSKTLTLKNKNKIFTIFLSPFIKMTYEQKAQKNARIFDSKLHTRLSIEGLFFSLPGNNLRFEIWDTQP